MKLLKLRCKCSDEERKGFIAYVVTRPNDTIEGIVIKDEHAVSCIRGIMKSDEMAFLKVSCSIDNKEIPRVFTFEEDTRKGYVSEFDLFHGFAKSWTKGWTIEIEEIEDTYKMTEVSTRFKYKVLALTGIEKSLIERYQALEEFLN